MGLFTKIKISRFTYDYVYGSRKVIKDPNNPFSNHFYGEDLWTDTGKRLEGLLPKGMVVYAEIIGWTNAYQPIQKGYTYGLPEGQRQLYVYRITQINPDGYAVDLSWDQVKEFCNNNGINHVPEIAVTSGWEANLQVSMLLDKNLFTYTQRGLPVDKGMVDEGVCIRRDGVRPLILKAKSPVFLQHETKLLDKDVVDIEAEA